MTEGSVALSEAADVIREIFARHQITSRTRRGATLSYTRRLHSSCGRAPRRASSTATGPRSKYWTGWGFWDDHYDDSRSARTSLPPSRSCQPRSGAASSSASTSGSPPGGSAAAS